MTTAVEITQPTPPAETRDGFIDQGLEIASLLPPGEQRDNFAQHLAEAWRLRDIFTQKPIYKVAATPAEVGEIADEVFGIAGVTHRHPFAPPTNGHARSGCTVCFMGRSHPNHTDWDGIVLKAVNNISHSFQPSAPNKSICMTCGHPDSHANHLF